VTWSSSQARETDGRPHGCSCCVHLHARCGKEKQWCALHSCRAHPSRTARKHNLIFAGRKELGLPLLCSIWPNTSDALFCPGPCCQCLQHFARFASASFEGCPILTNKTTARLVPMGHSIVWGDLSQPQSCEACFAGQWTHRENEDEDNKKKQFIFEEAMLLASARSSVGQSTTRNPLHKQKLTIVQRCFFSAETAASQKQCSSSLWSVCVTVRHPCSASIFF